MFPNSLLHTIGEFYDIDLMKNRCSSYLQKQSLCFTVSRRKETGMGQESNTAILASLRNDSPMMIMIGCPRVVLDIYYGDSESGMDLELLKFHAFKFLKYEFLRLEHEHQICASFLFESNTLIKKELEHFLETFIGVSIVNVFNCDVMELDIDNC